MKKLKITLLFFLISIVMGLSCFAMNVNEDFSESYGGFACSGYPWGINGSNGESASLEDGRLVIDPGNYSGLHFNAWIDCADSYSYTYYPSPGTSDYFDEFSASVDTYLLEGNENRRGIYICMQGNDSAVDAIWFILMDNNNYVIYKTIDWAKEIIVPETSSDIIKGQGEKNTLTINKEGDLFSFFINGYLVYNQQISGFPGGGVGITYDGNTKIAFDNFNIVEGSIFSNPPASPVLTVSTSGTTVNLSWNSVSGATGYTLHYAPYPFAGVQTIGQVYLGSDTTFSATLWKGASFYVTITSSNDAGESGYSNVELFTIPAQ